MVSLRNILTALAATLPLGLAAPIVNLDAADIVPNSFIIVMKDDLSSSAFKSHQDWADSILRSNRGSRVATFDLGSFKGYSASLTKNIADLLTASPDIAFIEPNTRVKASALITQSNAPYGLARISHKAKGSTDYVYDASAGSGTYAYIIDTGINTAHRSFGGRATFGANFAGDGINDDGNGHGTHVAGTTGSADYGVAKRTNLIAVKVLDASGAGSSAGVIEGIAWAANDAKAKGRSGKSVANLSLGGILSLATNRAVQAATKSGLFLELSSPSSEPSVCTVGATDKNDAKASFSNFGNVVDIWAPGVDIISTWIGSDTATNTISGTSMASPHIAGLGAYLIGLEGSRTPQGLCSRIGQLSTKGVITGILPLIGGKNQLAYNGNGA
jgi:subtilisin family serine protease